MSIVSERSRSGFHYFIAQAAQNALVAEGASCTVLPVEAAAATEREVVMFTISSYTFRILLFMHFDNSDVTRAYFGALADKSTDEMTGERFRDAVTERGNLLCGALNRDLSQFFPHIGMSTPCVLHRSAVEQIDAVKPAFTQRYRADISSSLALHLTVAVCAFADLDFPFEGSSAYATKNDGELEMF